MEERLKLDFEKIKAKKEPRAGKPTVRYKKPYPKLPLLKFKPPKVMVSAVLQNLLTVPLTSPRTPST